MRALAIVLTFSLGGCTVGQSATPATSVALSVTTYNLYLGADLITVFPPSSVLGTTETTTLPDRVRQAWEAVQASDPPARMDAVAAQITTHPTDVVLLQEASLWQTQTPADGMATPATDVAYDFVVLLRDALDARGLAYDVVVEHRLSDVEATGSFSVPMDVRLIDRDVILRRSDSALAISTTEQHEFVARIPLPTPVGDVSLVRGWARAAASIGGRSVSIVCTHLEAANDAIRDAQEAELLTDAATSDPLAMGGDFNLGPDTTPYPALVAAGLTDEWVTVHPNDPGPTCCEDPDLRNVAPNLTDRIDLLFTRGPLHAASAQIIGADPSAKTASGLWPSDHAGVTFDLGFE